MSKIALINIGMHGHVNPTLGFTEELVRRGHSLSYFCSPEFAPQIERTGAQFIAYGSDLGKMAAARATAQMQNPEAAAEAIAESQTFMVEELERTLSELLEALSRLRPDVIVYNFASLAARMVAERLEIPTVKFFTTYAGNEHFSPLKRYFGKATASSPEQRAELTERYAKAAARFGVKPCDPDSIFEHADKHNLVFMPRSFHLQSDVFDERYHFVGPCLRSEMPIQDTELSLPKTEDPLVLISLGTMFHEWPEFYKDCMQALKDLPVRVAMAIGPRIDPASLGEIPANVTLRPRLPQLALLQQASVFVSHGGMNSTMEALRFGVPLVVIPQMEEQEISAQRVEELELGAYIPKADFSIARLLSALEIAMSAKTRANVKRMQADVLEAGGTQRASDIIENACVPAARSLPRRSAEEAHAMEQL